MKTIFITGCSSGIGYYCANRLNELGYRVFASARKEEDLQKLKALGVMPIFLDINDDQSIQHAVDEIMEKTNGQLDALFNNAGILVAGAVEDLNREQLRLQFETNVLGPIELIHQIMPHMRKRGSGYIIQNSSILGLVSIPYYGAYTASKFALEAFSRSLRQELRNTNIHVSIINPGPITSELRKNAFSFYQDNLKGRVSPHLEAYRNIERNYFEKPNTNTPSKSPELVVKQLLKIIGSKHPKLHYYVGFTAHMIAFLNSILPMTTMDWILSKA